MSSAPVDPILATAPWGWWRGDTFTEAGGFATELLGRVGTEGAIELDALSGGLNPANPAANGQATVYIGDDADCMFALGAAMGFLNSAEFSWWMVFVSQPLDSARIWGAANWFTLDVMVLGGSAELTWGDGTPTPLLTLPVTAPGPSELYAVSALAPDAAAPADGSAAAYCVSAGLTTNNGYWASPPAASMPFVALGGGAGEGYTGYDFAELLIYDRPVPAADADRAVITAYLTARYGVPVP